METESDSLDVSGLKWTVLQSLQSESEESQLIRQRQLDAIKAAYEQLPPFQPATRVTTITTLPNAVPELASTVPDSQQHRLSNADLESEPNPPLPAHALNKAISIAQRMASQGSDTATQVLSPSHIASILNSRSRSANPQQDRAQDGYEEDENETQFTLHEGDEGHIDIVSNLILPQGQSNEIDSDPVDFSPTQSQRALPQFPESQRFKTPATAGKKRRHNGETVDSPSLPRNPLLRNGAQHDAFVMGLSQAFAATQADTSPFIGDSNGDIRSDLPSPNIQLQPRPVAATTSSPMQPIVSLFQRASTEPATRYISSKQSQAERDRLAFLKQQKSVADEEDDSEDGFDDEPSSIARDRRQRHVDQRRQATLERLSSPPKVSGRGMSLSKSSPIRPPSRDSPRTARTPRYIMPRGESSPAHAGSGSPSHESEVETEQEDNDEVAVTRSSQAHGIFEDEDKENYSDSGSQIPETAARLFHVMNELPQVQDSPSLRRGRPVVGTGKSALPYSSGPFVVSDSQPSQPQGGPSELKPIIIEADVDLVPQSPAAFVEATGASSKERTAEDSGFHRSDEKMTDTATDNVNEDSSLLQHLRGTMPETSANEQGQDGKESGKKQPSSESHGQYETARSRIPPSSSSQIQGDGVDMSSPQIATTPPGRRRKRMAENAAAPSPLKSEVSFDAEAVFRLDPDFQSPLRKSPMIDPAIVEEWRRSQSQPDPPERSQNVEEPHVLDPDRIMPLEASQHPANTGAIESRGTVISRQTPSELALSSYSRRARCPSTIKLVATSASSAQTSDSTSRRSPWDLDASPPQKSVPIIKSSGGKRKGRELEGLQNQDKQASRSTKRLKPSRGVSFSTTTPAEVNLERQALAQCHERPETSTLSEGHVSDAAKVATAAAAKTIVAPNMVFACFNGKTRAYYPALCLGPSNADNTRFLIQWEGYEPDEIDEHGIRRLDLDVGDQVKVNMEGFPKVSYVIQGFKDRVTQDNGKSRPEVMTDRQGHKTLLVAPKQRRSLPTTLSTDSIKEVPVSAIYLDSNMWGQMRDRVYQYKGADPVSSSGISTPLERPSTPTSPPSRNRRNLASMLPPVVPSITLPVVPPCNGMFANMAFAISYEDRSRKARLVELIEGHGGIMLEESFLDLLEPDSTAFRLKPQFAELSFTALLTERHSRKEKYMQALALGLPCLSGKWVEACIQSSQLVDWVTYLLPAGECAELDGATRSRLLLSTAALSSPLAAVQNTGGRANSISELDGEHMSKARVKVKDMISSRLNILGGSRVIVVMGKGKAEVRRKPYLFLIRALGAGKIELEPDLVSAKARLSQSLANADTNGNDGHAVAAAEAEDGDGSGNVGGPIDWVFVDDRDASAARSTILTSTSASASVSASLLTSKSKLKSTSLSPATGSAQDKTEHQHQATDKAMDKICKIRNLRKGGGDHQTRQRQPDKDEQPPRQTTPLTPNESSTRVRTVKVMCNEDIVQTLILGKLWIGT